jgi:hypothetical protein
MQKAAGTIEAAVGKVVHSSTLQAKGEELHQKGFDQIEAAKRHHLPDGVLGEDKQHQKAATSGTCVCLCNMSLHIRLFAASTSERGSKAVKFLSKEQALPLLPLHLLLQQCEARVVLRPATWCILCPVQLSAIA